MKGSRRRAVLPRLERAGRFAALFTLTVTSGCAALPRLLLGDHPERLLLTSLIEEQVAEPEPELVPSPTRKPTRATPSPTKSAPTTTPAPVAEAPAPNTSPSIAATATTETVAARDAGSTPTEAVTPSPTPFEILDTRMEAQSLLASLRSGAPPSSVAAVRMIEDGRVKMGQGRFDVALDRFEHAVSLDPGNPYGFYYLARLHAETNKLDQAIAFAGRAVALSAATDKTCLGRAYTLQGIVFERVGRYADARTAFDDAIAADARNLEARLGKARLGGE